MNVMLTYDEHVDEINFYCARAARYPWLIVTHSQKERSSRAPLKF